MSSIFITGIGTEVGKTYVTHSLLDYDRQKGSRLKALKPLISGVTPENIKQSDSAVLLSGMGEKCSTKNIQKISPWSYQTPAAPDIAQRVENQSFHWPALIHYCQEQMALAKQDNRQILIEGVGGLMSPISQSQTVLDWINALSMPVLLVAGSYLGSISHTLTCLSTLQMNKIPILGIVLNESNNSTVSIFETKRSLKQFTEIPIFVYRYQQGRSHAVANLYTYLTRG